MKKKGMLILLLLCFLFVRQGVFAGLGNILNLHLQYGGLKVSQKVSFSGNVQRNFSDDLWFVFSQSDIFLQTNIPLLLEVEPRSEKLISYLRDGNLLLQALNYHYSYIESELQTLESNFHTCEADLETANQNFSMSIANNNESWFYHAIEEAKKARSCMGEQGVMISANHFLKERIKRFISAIEPRVSYLQKNQELIIMHYDILKPTLLEELYHISLELEQE